MAAARPSRRVRLPEARWRQLRELAAGLGCDEDVLLERAVLTLAQLHGYPVPRGAAPTTAERAPTLDAVPVPHPSPGPALGDDDGGPKSTRVEGVDHRRDGPAPAAAMPVITAEASAHQPAIVREKLMQLTPPTELARSIADAEPARTAVARGAPFEGQTALEPALQPAPSRAEEPLAAAAFEPTALSAEPGRAPEVSSAPTALEMPVVRLPLDVDADPARRAAARRMEEIEGDLERLALPRKDRALALDGGEGAAAGEPSSAATAQSSPRALTSR